MVERTTGEVGPKLRNWTGILLYTVLGTATISVVLFVLFYAFFQAIGIVHRLGLLGHLFSVIGFFAAAVYGLLAIALVYSIWMPFKVAVAHVASRHYQGESASLRRAGTVAYDRSIVAIRWGTLKGLAGGMRRRMFGPLATFVHEYVRGQSEGDVDLVAGYVIPAIAVDDPDTVSDAFDTVEGRLGEPTIAPSVFGVGLYVLPILALLTWTVILLSSYVIGYRSLLTAVGFVGMLAVLLLGCTTMAAIDTVERTKHYVRETDRVKEARWST